MKRKRNRIERTRDHPCARPGRLERRRQRRAASSLAVQTDGHPARLADALDELACPGRIEGPRRVVDEDARGAELPEVIGPLEQDVRVAPQARAVHEPDSKLFPRCADRLCRLLEIRKVVQRVVDPEDVDAALGRAGHEAGDEISGERTGADEQPPSQRHAERRRAARADGADPLPGALHSPAHRRVEAASARHLEVREAGRVEDLRELEDPRGLHPLRERLLREEPDAGVDEGGHG